MNLHNLKYGLVIAAAIGFSACQKEEISSEDSASAALASTEGQEQTNDMDMEATFRMDPSQDVSGGCPTITWASPRGTFPNTITVDFGTGCTGFNGRTKKGQIVVEVSADHFSAGAVRTVTPVGFSVDDFQIEGLRVVTNMGLNESSQMYWTVEGTHNVTSPEGNESSLVVHHVRTMTEGLDTPEDCQDDVYQITGTNSGVTPRGHEFTGTITTPLVKRMDCRWPVSGVEAIDVEGTRGDRSIDFGNGDCDDKATVTNARGEVKEITIRRR